ncbi:metallophosphoesterase family protein [Hymenobacter arizonensis]|uniref:Serine/threonine protein phosphatase 1 n=1 Tax=Hymenobacter arizonensis TaxID=1227077 RepID=A0A1I5SNG6_HYMAR|nr:metallophosphoesterase family protein [Hymenobacter arizonensis]SFP72255.1 serine/threonine protein phosphatase 1 [Hymenobacter arizonensis]
MNIFIVGDVHGCFHTFGEVLTHWQPATDHLIQVGDLVDRGRYVVETVELARQLSEAHPSSTTFLMGNHEQGMLRHFGPAGPYPSWLLWGGRSTLEQYKCQPKKLALHLPWLAERPLHWQNDHLLVSHAGLADSPHANDPTHPDGLLWRRGPLKKLNKLQVVGHTPTPKGQPLTDTATNTLYIDTGAFLRRHLTAVRLSPTAELLDIVSVRTHRQDVR